MCRVVMEIKGPLLYSIHMYRHWNLEKKQQYTFCLSSVYACTYVYKCMSIYISTNRAVFMTFKDMCCTIDHVSVRACSVHVHVVRTFKPN